MYNSQRQGSVSSSSKSHVRTPTIPNSSGNVSDSAPTHLPPMPPREATHKIVIVRGKARVVEI